MECREASSDCLQESFLLQVVPLDHQVCKETLLAEDGTVSDCAVTISTIMLIAAKEDKKTTKAEQETTTDETKPGISLTRWPSDPRLSGALEVSEQMEEWHNQSHWSKMQLCIYCMGLWMKEGRHNGL